jgi:hypothetical protein
MPDTLDQILQLVEIEMRRMLSDSVGISGTQESLRPRVRPRRGTPANTTRDPELEKHSAEQRSLPRAICLL